MSNKTDVFCTKDNIVRRIVFEILVHKCEDLTIKEAKSIARTISIKVRHGLSEVDKQGLSLKDEQMHDMSFWIDQVLNSGKDFNQKPK